jgi:histone-binding protein RBBP4
MWDTAEAGLEVQALQIKRGHTSVVEDVAWSHHHAHVFGSVGDDMQLLIWDVRDGGTDPSKRVEEAHRSDINCVAFNPLNEFLLATV